eukprot:m.142165 g.142165  ORF g.142165 m.142165 type:complete len:670 (-) comp16145_c0_seq2:30-2039(-)
MPLADQLCFVWGVGLGAEMMDVQAAASTSFMIWLIEHAANFEFVQGTELYSHLEQADLRNDLISWLEYWDSADETIALLNHIRTAVHQCEEYNGDQVSPFGLIARQFLVNTAQLTLKEAASLSTAALALAEACKALETTPRPATVTALLNDTTRQCPRTHVRHHRHSHHHHHALANGLGQPQQAADKLLTLLADSQRTKEHTTALGAATWLYDGYAKQVTPKQQDSVAKITGPQYAALTRAKLEYDAQNSDQVLLYVQEAVRIAQSLNDLECLKQCLAWLATLEGSHAKAIVLLKLLHSNKVDAALRMKTGAELALRHFVNGDGLPSALEAIDTSLVGASPQDGQSQAVLYSVRASLLEQAGSCLRAQQDLEMLLEQSSAIPVMTEACVMSSLVRLHLDMGRTTASTAVLDELQSRRIPGYVGQEACINWITCWHAAHIALYDNDLSTATLHVAKLKLLAAASNALQWEYQLILLQCMVLEHDTAKVHQQASIMLRACLSAIDSATSAEAMVAIRCLRQLFPMLTELYISQDLVEKAKALVEEGLAWAVQYGLNSLQCRLQAMQAYLQETSESPIGTLQTLAGGSYADVRASLTYTLELLLQQSDEASLPALTFALQQHLSSHETIRKDASEKQAYSVLARAHNVLGSVDSRNACAARVKQMTHLAVSS